MIYPQTSTNSNLDLGESMRCNKIVSDFMDSYGVQLVLIKTEY